MENISNLSRILLGIGSDLGGAIPESLRLYHDAQELVISTPGFAEYLRDRVLAAQKARKEAVGTDEYGPKKAEFLRLRSNSLGTLAHLPSPDSVRVLGEFLSDDSGPEFNVQGSRGEDPMSWSAVGALSQLPLVNPPAKFPNLGPYVHFPSALPPWRSWLEQIKAGNRTFRFEGDPTEYDLDGPASKTKVERITKNRERDAERQTGHRKKKDTAIAEKAGPQEAQKRWPTIIAVCVFSLVLAGWYFSTRKR